MRIEHRLPAVPLRALIDRYWRWEQTASTPPPLLPVMPGPGGMEVFFHFGAPFARHTDAAQPCTLPSAHLVCVRSAPLTLQATGRIGFVAARLRAGAAAYFTGCPVETLADRCVAMADVWGPRTHRLADRIADAPSLEAAAPALDEFFLRALRAPAQGACIAAAIARLQREDLRIAALAESVGLGRRQLENRFRHATGVSPVRFRRLARLRRSLRRLLLGPAAPSLTALLDPGYVDQAQQAREYRALTGFSPSQLRRASSDIAHFYNSSWQR